MVDAFGAPNSRRLAVSSTTDFCNCCPTSDVWFQQPPEVLIDRFVSLTNELFLRLSEPVLRRTAHLHSQMADSERVLLGADKRCWPPLANAAECTDVPQSHLPSLIYGQSTDTGAELQHVGL